MTEFKIITAFPPNFEAIAAAFPFVRGRAGIVYAWGDRVYNPSGVQLPQSIIEHEGVHLQQQSDPAVCAGVEDWWDRYLRDPAFRLDQETPAHIMEYVVATEYGMANRHTRRAYLDIIAGRLSSPLYGRMIPRAKAETLLRLATKGPKLPW